MSLYYMSYNHSKLVMIDIEHMNIESLLNEFHEKFDPLEFSDLSFCLEWNCKHLILSPHEEPALDELQ